MTDQDTLAPAKPKMERPKPRPLAVRLNDAAHMLGLARTTVFAMLKDGRLEGRKIGKATVVTQDSIDAFWKSLPAIERTK